MFEIITIIILALIIISLLVERFLFARHMTQQLGNATKAVMSRNINEYVAAITAEKPLNRTQPEQDEVLETELPDEAFDKFIESQQ